MNKLRVNIINKEFSVTLKTVQALASKLNVTEEQCKFVIDTSICTFSGPSGYKPLFCIEVDSPLYKQTPFMPIDIETILDDSFDFNIIKA